MDAFLHLPAERRRLLCAEAQTRLGLPPASIEKDFWVCWTLHELFRLPVWGEQLTFKGGTSLSKGWKLIERFSEDVDVVIDREFLGFGENPLGSKRRKKLRDECSSRIQGELRPALEQRLSEILPEDLDWGLASADQTEDPELQTLLFDYPSVFAGSLGYVRPVVKIELGARSDTEPAEERPIQPYLAEAFPDLMTESTFPLRTVAARRTFWEKAMLLHEEGFRPADKPRRARLARHYYDLWCLIRAGVAAEAVADHALFDRVAAHRKMFFKQSWVDYDTLHRERLRVVPVTDQVADWRRDYEAMRGEMFFNEPPTFDEILEAVRQFEEDLHRP